MARQIRWYVNRLLAMEPAEVLWRLSSLIRAYFDLSRFMKNKTIDKLNYKIVAAHQWQQPPIYSIDWLERIPFLHPDEWNETCRITDAACRNEFDLGTFGTKRFHKEIDWMHALHHEASWPIKPTSAILLRGNDVPGDIRFCWELNRFAVLTSLAQRYAVTGDSKWALELERLLSDWIKSNPIGIGVHYISAMEHAIRAIQLCWCYSLLNSRPDAPSGTLALIIKTVQLFIRWIWRHRARYSSSNNHLIIELSAIVIVHGAIPQSVTAKLAERCWHMLAEQTQLQFHADGMNAEQSFHYHQFSLEALLLALRSAKYQKRSLPNSMLERIALACEFAAVVMDSSGHLPHVGDSDDGHLTNFILSAPVPTLLHLAGWLLDRPDLSLAANDQQSLALSWLMGPEGVAENRAPDYNRFSPNESRTFPNGGLTLLKNEGAHGKTSLLFDHGPLGFGSLAAHAHADALQVLLFVDGKALLGDPGTYIYNVEQLKRNQFRSTRYHNTISLDGRDQSEMLGPFLWGRKAAASLVAKGEDHDCVWLHGTHHGYHPYNHSRIIIQYSSGQWLIEDRILPSDVSGECTWNIDPSCIVVQNNDHEYTIQSEQTVLWVLMEAGHSDTELVPSEASAYFGQLQSAYQLKLRWKSGISVVRTFLSLSGPMHPEMQVCLTTKAEEIFKAEGSR